MNKILLIEDNPEIQEANRDYLTGKGYQVDIAMDGKAAIALLKSRKYDCIVLDILLPDMDGYAVCKATRTLTDAPIIFLSCLDEVDDKIKGLLTGGDDYMTKPYSLEELTARIHARIRSSQRRAPSQDGGVHIDYEACIIQTCGRSVFLSQKEFDLFLLLHEKPRRVFSKEELLERLWRPGADVGTVAVHVMKLRRKIGFAEEQIGRIETGYGEGYYLEPPRPESGSGAIRVSTECSWDQESK